MMYFHAFATTLVVPETQYVCIIAADNCSVLHFHSRSHNTVHQMLQMRHKLVLLTKLKCTCILHIAAQCFMLPADSMHSLISTSNITNASQVSVAH